MLSQFSASDAINFFLFLTAIVGIFLTLLQVRAGYVTQKATFFRDMQFALINDQDIADIINLVSSGNFKFDETNFFGSPLERQLDKTLLHLETACELFFQRLITHREMKFVNYVVVTVVMEPEVQKYLTFVENAIESSKHNVSIYSSLNRYTRKYYDKEAIRKIAAKVQAYSSKAEKS